MTDRYRARIAAQQRRTQAVILPQQPPQPQPQQRHLEIDITKTNKRAFNINIMRCDTGDICVYRDSDRSVRVAKIDISGNQLLEDTLSYDVNITDPKLFRWREKNFVCYSSPGYGLHLEFMEFCPIALDSIEKKVRLLTIFDYPGYVKQREKSWTPFTYNDQLYFLYKRNPHVVLEFFEEISIPRYHSDFDHGELIFPQEFITNDIRGNGSCIQLNKDELFVTFHNRIGDDYLIGGYTFQAHPPFAPLRMCKGPLIDSKQIVPEFKRRGYDKYGPLLNTNSNCVFPSGMLLCDGRILISAGLNDYYNMLIKMDLHVLDQMLVTCRLLG